MKKIISLTLILLLTLSVSATACASTSSTTAQTTTVEKVEETLEIHCDSVGALFDVAESYLDVAYDPNDALIYGYGRGWGMDNTTDDDGNKAIDCSEFVEACIGGIYYENNRYIDPNARVIRAYWGWCSDGSGTYSNKESAQSVSLNYNDYTSAASLARYFDDYGQLLTYHTGHDDAIRPGDLLFYTSDSSGNWNQITHVGICAYKNGEHYGLLQSTKNRNRLIDGEGVGVLITHETLSKRTPAYFVHSPIIAEYTTEKVYSCTDDWSGTTTSEDLYTICTLPIDENLDRHVYTINFDLVSDCDYACIYAYYGELDDESNCEIVGYNQYCTGKCSAVFYAQEPIKYIQIMSSGGTSYKCTDIELYKGYHTP